MLNDVKQRQIKQTSSVWRMLENMKEYQIFHEQTKPKLHTIERSLAWQDAQLQAIATFERRPVAERIVYGRKNAVSLLDYLWRWSSCRKNDKRYVTLRKTFIKTKKGPCFSVAVNCTAFNPHAVEVNNNRFHCVKLYRSKYIAPFQSKLWALIIWWL